MSICHFASLDISGILSPFEEFEVLLELTQLGVILDLDKNQTKTQLANVGYTVTSLVSKAFT